MALPKRPFTNSNNEREEPVKSQEERRRESDAFYHEDTISLDESNIDLTEEPEDDNILENPIDPDYELEVSIENEEDELLTNLLSEDENLDDEEFEIASHGEDQLMETPENFEMISDSNNTTEMSDFSEIQEVDETETDRQETQDDLLDSQVSPSDELSEDYNDIDLLNPSEPEDEQDDVGEASQLPVPPVPSKLPKAPSKLPSRPITANPNVERIQRFLSDSKDIDEQARLNPDKFKPVDRLNEERKEPVKPAFKMPERNNHLKQFGGISASFAVDGNYEIYQHLEDKIRKMVTHIQSTLSDQGKAEWIGEARRARNTEKYYDAVKTVDRLVTREISKNTGISVESQDSKYFTASVVNEILGFGPLEPLWGDPAISEIMVNGPFSIRVERNGKTQVATGVRFRDQEHAMKTAESFLAYAGRPFSIRTPYADSSLPDGSRINAVHPEISPDGPVLTIRRFPDTIFSMEKLVNMGSMDEDMAVTLGNIVNMGISVVVAGGTGTGKALSADTPIPTPAGLIRLGELEVGDTVFDQNGEPTKITHVFDQPDGRDCFIVKFNDGTSVIADAEHNWFVNGKVVTTQEMVEEVGSCELRVPLTKPVQYATQDLPVDPYLLGFWLACSNPDGKLTGENYDAEQVLTDRGVDFTRVYENRGFRLEVNGFSESLEALGLSNGLETNDPLLIPEAYLIASEGQRRGLLAGILDNDAILHNQDGKIEVVINNNSALGDQILRLAGSLGIFAYKKEINYGDMLITTVIMETEQDVFYCKGLAKQHSENRVSAPDYKLIVEINPVESVKVRCITVDSSDHLYLFGETYTVTHNTSMLNALSGCIDADERIITIEDTLELKLHSSKYKLALRSRPPSATGTDAVTIRDLVRNTLRMRPDRIVVGEVRDESAYDMMQAMSTGHDGSLTTTHASNPEGTIERLALLSSQSGEISPDRALSLIAGAVDIIINLERFHEDGSRRVTAVSEIPSNLTEQSNGRLTLEPRILWEWVRDGEDENGRLHGHYEKRNEFSESFVRKYALDKRKPKTLEEIYELSKVEAPNENPNNS